MKEKAVFHQNVAKKKEHSVKKISLLGIMVLFGLMFATPAAAVELDPVPHQTPECPSNFLACLITGYQWVGGECLCDGEMPEEPDVCDMDLTFDARRIGPAEIYEVEICGDASPTILTPWLHFNSPLSGKYRLYAYLLWEGEFYVAETDLLGHTVFIPYRPDERMRSYGIVEFDDDHEWTSQAFEDLGEMDLYELAEKEVILYFAIAPKGRFGQIKGAGFTFIE